MTTTTERLLRIAMPLGMLLYTVTCWGQLPATRLDGVHPAGGRAGEAVEVTIFGNDLDDVDSLQFNHSGISARQSMAEETPFDDGPQPIEGRFEVTINGNVPPGRYEVRCQGKYGISGARCFMVGSVPEVTEGDASGGSDEPVELAEMPIVVNGRLAASAEIDEFQFQGERGQRLQIVGHAAAIDSPAALVVELVSPSGKVIAEARRRGNTDPLIDATLPEAGVYGLRVYDQLYTGRPENVYRLWIGNRPTIDFVFPPAGVPGTNERYTVYGRNLPGGQPAPWQRDGAPLERLQVQIAIPGDLVDQIRYSDRLDPHHAGIDGMEYRIASGREESNPVLIAAARGPLVEEQDNNDTPQSAQRLAPPCDVAGRFYPRGDVDWYSFEAEEDEEFYIEVVSHRLGAATDTTLVVLAVETDESGEESMRRLEWVTGPTERTGGFEFDDRHNDPGYRFKAPASGTYRLLLRDGHSSVAGDPSLVYLLSIRPPDPDFRLAIAPLDSSGALLLRQGGREAVRVILYRRDGFDGEVTVQAKRLPRGVTAPQMTAGPDCTQLILPLSAEAGASAQVGEIEVIGTATIAGRTVTRTARIYQPLAAVQFGSPNDRNQASVPTRRIERLPVVVTDDEKDPVVIAAEESGTLETSRGGVVSVKYKVQRESGAGGNITGFAVGLPPTMNVPQFNLGGDRGELQLRFPANMTPGTYTVNVAAMLQGMSYSRNPEAAAKAKQRQQRVAKVYADAQQEARQAQQAAVEANNRLNQANSRLAQAKTAETNAQRSAEEAEKAHQSAEAASAEARRQAVQSPDDEAMKKAVADAEKTLDEAGKKLQEAKTTADSAVEELQAATEQQQETTEQKQQADESLQQAQQFQQTAQQESQRADQAARQAEQLAARRNINRLIFATPVTIQVDDYPIRLKGPDAKFHVRQGEKVDIPLSLERLYGFNQNVNVQTILPEGAAGLQVPTVNLAGNQNSGQVVVNAANNATPGDHELTLRVTLNFNGQNLTLERSCVLTVIEVEPQ